MGQHLGYCRGLWKDLAGLGGQILPQFPNRQGTIWQSLLHQIDHLRQRPFQSFLQRGQGRNRLCYFQRVAEHRDCQLALYHSFVVLEGGGVHFGGGGERICDDEGVAFWELDWPDFDWVEGYIKGLSLYPHKGAALVHPASH